MATECGCTPGNYENGWQEHRSDTCEAQEREAWRAATLRIMTREATTDGPTGDGFEATR